MAEGVRVVRSGEGKALWVVGDAYRMVATAEETGGRYAVCEARVEPGGGPPPHRHSREAEAFFVLEGEVTFRVEGEPVVADAGTFVHLPEGVAHSFRNEAGETARMLILMAPGGFERMFLEVGREAERWGDPAEPPSPGEIERLKAAAPRYGVELLGG